MKKIIIAIAIVVGLTHSTSAQTTLATPASCPKTVTQILSNLGGGQYQLLYQWNNPTSGAKSINLMVNGGSTLNVCIDATNDGSQTFPFFSATSPLIVVTMHTGNSTCLGTICGSSLPLLLKSFTAQRNNQSVDLSWSIVKEMVEQGESFSVQRSLDGVGFSIIATIAASPQVDRYSYQDNYVANKVFYRLVLNNNAGKKYSSTISVVTDKNGPKIEVPQNGNTIRLSRLSGSEVVVFNTAGQPLKTFKVIGDPASINIEGLNPGIYFVRCITKDGITISQAFIK